MTTASEPWAWLARIRRPQGRKGEVFAELLTDFPEKFAERRQLWLLPENVSSSTSAGAPAPSHLGTRATRPVDSTGPSSSGCPGSLALGDPGDQAH